MTSTWIVVSGAGPAWAPGVAMREQAGWAEHATFMDRLAEDGFVVLGGALGVRGHRAMLVVRGADEPSVGARLAADPWRASGVLRLVELSSWDVLLGALPE